MAFNNASNFSIGSARIEVSGGSNGHWTCPLQLLFDNSSVDATTDSVSASYAPRCHPETREAVTKHIMDWAQDSLAPKPVLWISGPAGAGKTCIQRKIVDILKKKGLFAASFFFSTKSMETSNESRLVSTLALQLADTTPAIKTFIVKAVEDDPGIFRKSLEAQAESLIFCPLQNIRGSLASWLLKGFLGSVGWVSQASTRPKFIVIDGLDACTESKEQAHIVHLVQMFATHPLHPFRVILTSRPEYEIRKSFASPPLNSITRTLKLESYEAESDIRRYLISELARLRNTHPCASVIPLNWPSPRDIQKLVRKASGQFIFVATVIKYLDHPRRNPVAELKNILGLPQESLGGANPFAKLDALYAKVLHPHDADIPLLRIILHTIMHNRGSFLNTTSGIDLLLELDPGTTDIALSDLHSIVSLKTRITFHHKSMKDFLMSPTRAGDLYQDVATTNLRLTEAYYRLSNSKPSGSWEAHEYFCLALQQATCEENQAIFRTEELILETLPESVEEVLLVAVSTFVSSRPEDQSSLGIVQTCSRHFADAYHQYACPKYSECLPPCQRLKRIVEYEDEIWDLAGDVGLDGLSKRTILEDLIEGDIEV